MFPDSRWKTLRNGTRDCHEQETTSRNAAGRGEGVIPQVLAEDLEDGLGEDGLPAEPAACFACYCFFVLSVLLFFVFLRV